jgi:hypothetical protein
VGSADAVACVFQPVAEVELDRVADQGLGRDEAIRCRLELQTLRDLLEQRSACSVLGAAGLANSMERAVVVAVGRVRSPSLRTHLGGAEAADLSGL